MANTPYSDMIQHNDSDYDADASSSASGLRSTSTSSSTGSGSGSNTGAGTGTGCSGLAFVRWIRAYMANVCQFLCLVGFLSIVAISTLTEVCFIPVSALLMGSDREITVAITTIFLRIGIFR